MWVLGQLVGEQRWNVSPPSEELAVNRLLHVRSSCAKVFSCSALVAEPCSTCAQKCLLVLPSHISPSHGAALRGESFYILQFSVLALACWLLLSSVQQVWAGTHSRLQRHHA